MIQETETMKKLPYTKPTLRPIELITDEVLSVNCKVGGLNPCDNPQADNFGS